MRYLDEKCCEILKWLCITLRMFYNREPYPGAGAILHVNCSYIMKNVRVKEMLIEVCYIL